MALGARAMRGISGGHAEGETTKSIESATAEIPSIAFLGFALGSMALSWIFLMAGRRNLATFIGQWAPTVLILGLYNKLVKLHGSD